MIVRSEGRAPVATRSGRWHEARAALGDLVPHVVAPRTWRKVATWRPLRGGRVRVIVTTWGARDVVAQHAWTLDSLRDAWPLLTQVGAVHENKARDPQAFLAWALFARR